MTILFPHIPKTGGTSFLKALKEKYGDRLLLDYTNNQRHNSSISLWLKRHINGCRKERLASKYDVIYGHFDPNVYQLAGFQEGMFFRDPIDRAISHYNYLQSRKLVSETMTLVEFAAQPKIKYIYRYYCGRVSIDDLAFVGITERYKESLELFSKIFGVMLPEYRERVGAQKIHVDINPVSLLQADNQRIYDAALRRFDFLYHKYL